MQALNRSSSLANASGYHCWPAKKCFTALPEGADLEIKVGSEGESNRRPDLKIKPADCAQAEVRS